MTYPSSADARRPQTESWPQPQHTVPADAGPMPRPRARPGTTAELMPTREPGPSVGIAITATCTTIGRDRACDIVLDDATVSRHHAELHHPEHARYLLVDAGSLNGIYHNRRRTPRAELADGDEIWIGKARFVFQLR